MLQFNCKLFLLPIFLWYFHISVQTHGKPHIRTRKSTVWYAGDPAADGMLAVMHVLRAQQCSHILANVMEAHPTLNLRWSGKEEHV